jgi:hypothetical protein
MMQRMRVAAARVKMSAVALWALVLAILSYAAFTILPQKLEAQQYCCGAGFGCESGEFCSQNACSGFPGTRTCVALS